MNLEKAYLEDVLESLKSDRDDLVVLDREQVAEGLDATLLHQVLDLLGGAARRGVADRPGRLLLHVELGSLSW